MTTGNHQTCLLRVPAERGQAASRRNARTGGAPKRAPGRQARQLRLHPREALRPAVVDKGKARAVSKNRSEVKGAQSRLTLCDPVDCTVRGILQAEHWSGEPFPSPGDLPDPGIKPRSPALHAVSLPAEPQRKPKNAGVSSLSLLQWIFVTQESGVRGNSHTVVIHALPRWPSGKEPILTQETKRRILDP